MVKVMHLLFTEQLVGNIRFNCCMLQTGIGAKAKESPTNLPAVQKKSALLQSAKNIFYNAKSSGCVWSDLRVHATDRVSTAVLKKVIDYLINRDLTNNYFVTYLCVCFPKMSSVKVIQRI